VVLAAVEIKKTQTLMLVALFLGLLCLFATTNKSEARVECLVVANDYLPDAKVCDSGDFSDSTGAIESYHQDREYYVLVDNTTVYEGSFKTTLEQVIYERNSSYFTEDYWPAFTNATSSYYVTNCTEGIGFDHPECAHPYCTKDGVETKEAFQICANMSQGAATVCGGDYWYCDPTSGYLGGGALLFGCNSTGGGCLYPCAWGRTPKCVSNYVYYCTMARYKTVKYIFVPNRDPNIKFNKLEWNVSFTAQWLIYSTDAEDVQMLIGDFGARTLNSLDLNQIIISYHSKLISVSSPATGLSGQVIITKPPYQALYPYTGGSVDYRLPQEVFITSGVVKVAVYISGDLAQTASFNIVGEKLCVLKDCVICWDAFQNWDCLTPANKALLIFLFILLIMLCIIALPVSVYAAYWILWCLICPFRYIFMMGRAFLRSRFMRDSKNKVVKLKDVKDYFFSKDVEGGKALMMLFLFMSIGLSQTPPVFAQCATGQFILADLTSCLVSGTTKTCNAEFSLAGSTPTPGVQTCFTILDASNNLTVIGQGFVDYLAFEVTYPTINQYWTYPWYGEWHSRTRCDDSPPCHEDCQSTYPNDATAAGQIEDPLILNNPGEAFCRRGCGCAGCGCFLCSDSCIYSSYGLVFDNTTVQYSMITTLGTPVSTIYIRLRILNNFQNGGVDANVVLDQTVAVQGAQAFVYANYSFAYVGAYTYNSANFGDLKVSYEPPTGRVYLVNAADVNIPKAGGLGDIQAPNIQVAMTGSRTAAIFDPAMVERDQGSSDDNYVFQTPGYFDYSKYIFLPTTVGGSTWDGDATPSGDPTFPYVVTLESNITNAPAIQWQLSTVSPVVFVQDVSLVCPRASFVNATGCFNCLQGVSMYINAYSSCLPGSALLKVNGTGIALSTLSVVLPQNAADILVELTVSRVSTDFCLTLIANGGNASFCATITAVPFNGITNHTTNGGKGYPSFSGAGVGSGIVMIFEAIANFLKRIFTGEATWWEWIIFAILATVVIVGFFLLLPFILRSIASMVSSIRKIRGFRKRKTEPQSPTVQEYIVKDQGTVRRRSAFD